MSVEEAPSGGKLVPLRVSARTDYALRAAAELAARAGQGLVKAEAISQAQRIPHRFLLSIMTDLRRGGVVRSHRGADGGFELARSPDQIPLLDVVIAVEGGLATVQNGRPDDSQYVGAARSLRDVWLAMESTMESVLRRVSLADLVDGS